MKRLTLVTSIAAAVAGHSSLAQESINLADLDGSNGFVLTGIDADDQSGVVSNAGDVNGDGIDDVIISAPAADPVVASEGETYVVFGNSVGFPASFDLANLDGSNGFVLNGIDIGDASGVSVSAAGDVNADGIDDIIISALAADPGSNAEGESYVVFGSNTGFSASFDLSSLNGSNGFVLNGIDPTDRSGRFVDGAGDVNGDGIDDVIIGAYLADPGTDDEGESYVVFGTDLGFSASIDLANLDGSNGFVVNGINANDYSGQLVGRAGDVNGDGIDDVIIGAPIADPGGSASGATYVVFGSDAGFVASIDLASLDGSNGFALNGLAPGDISGRSASGAGDVNGDGIDDVIIGASFADPDIDGEGQTYVVFGSNSGFSASFDLASLDGSNGFVLNGIDANDFSGRFVSGAGDFNGDGIDDILIGAEGADPSGDDSGETYVVFGSRAGFSASFDLATLDGTNGLALNGVDPDDNSGFTVSGAGDVNGDGIDDIIIGADGADVDIGGEGESYLVFGNATPLALGHTIVLFEESEDESNPLDYRLDLTFAPNYVDVDPFAGAAVTADASSGSEGQWQYSTDGVDWFPMPTLLSNTAAVVLTGESSLRFVPAANFFGTPGALTVRLWDGR
ncbi:MAG: integrin alpha [Pseudomonadota bacterium]